MKKKIISVFICALGVASMVYAHGLPVMREGWPKMVMGNHGKPMYNHISLYKTVDSEPIIGFGTNHIVTLYTMDGDTLPGWPITPRLGDYYPIVASGPRLGDIDGDGQPEAVISYVDEYDGVVYVRVFSINGREIDRMSRENYYTHADASFSYNSPIFYDLDGNRCDELMYIGKDSVCAIEGSGSACEGFPWPLNDRERTTFQTPLVIPEEYGGPIVLWMSYSKVHARRIGDEAELPGWPVSPGFDKARSFLSGMPNGDSWLVTVSDGDSLWVMDASGQQIRHFPLAIVEGRHNTVTTVQMADHDSNGIPDLFARSYSTYNEMMGVTLAGEHFPGFPLELGPGGAGEIFGFFRIVGDPVGYFVGEPHSGSRSERHVALIHGNEYVEGYPWIYSYPESMGSEASTILLPVRNDTLGVITANIKGCIAIYDIPLETNGNEVIFEWSQPACNPGGNRFYDPHSGMDTSCDKEVVAPETPELGAIYPNPFNGMLTVELEAPAKRELTFEVYNVLGKKVAEEAVKTARNGKTKWSWNAGEGVSSGVYLITVREVPGFVRKAVLVR